MKTRYGENPQTQWAGIAPFANRRAAGWVVSKDRPILLSVHPREKSGPISWAQAHIAYLLGRWILCKSAPSGLGNEPRNVCLDA